MVLCLRVVREVMAERLGGGVVVAADRLQRVKVGVDLIEVYKILGDPAIQL